MQCQDQGLDHDFQYQGLVAAISDHLRPGSGAHYVYYAHVYFCRKCMFKHHENVPGDHSSYEPLQSGAVRASEADSKKILGTR
jgi:hypothetical protein